MTRSRFAPAFFTLYIPFGLVLFLIDPDPAATRVAYGEAAGNLLGRPNLVTVVESSFALALTAGFTAMALGLGYWLRSKRVKAVFGSTGLGLFRRDGSG